MASDIVYKLEGARIDILVQKSALLCHNSTLVGCYALHTGKWLHAAYATREYFCGKGTHGVHCFMVSLGKLGRVIPSR